MSQSSLQGTINQLLIRWVFVVIPTVVIGYITIVYLNSSYTLFTSSVLNQAIFFGVGLTVGYSLYFFRTRAVITFILLWFTYWLVGKIITRLPGEFDVFYATAKYQLYSAMFLFGWIFGFLLVRVRYSHIILFGVLTIATLIAISGTIDISLSYILMHLVPVSVYGLYMLFLSPILIEGVELDRKKSLRLFLRFSLFLVLVLLAFVFVESIFNSDLKAVEKELAARGAKSEKDGGLDKKDGGYDERYGLMESKDDGYKLKDTMKINSKMSQSDRLMFCSKLDNYFPDGSPKPLYYVYHYLTKYDAARESFVRDVDVPSFDEFDADPSELAMYHSKFDTSIIRKSLGRKKRVIVESQVYLSSNNWKHALLAPAGAFYIQTIPIEKDFQKDYYSAYKVKSYASELNNAYFVYNPSASPALETYQQERHAELRNVNDYRNVDSAFYSYYTQMPSGVLYDSISALAKNLITGDMKPVDKVLAIQNLFLAEDENGKRIFRYTLKPGGVNDPNIPSSKMLSDFLFKTHAGYCTYYAGASLFLLRSLGIPSRFTTGFATVNRNDKNKGWYWFYASQAHAWTQVYFPGYGWMDFDMTIGNEEQQGAPRPDGTPPLPPPEPWLVLNGIAPELPDLKLKQLKVSFSSLIYFDKGYELEETFTRTVDASLCRVVYNKKDTTLDVIQVGDSIIVVSYKDDAKRIPKPIEGVSIESQLAGFPSPIIADEIHVKAKDTGKKKEPEKKKTTKAEEKAMTWQEILMLTAKIFGGAIVFVFLVPLLFLIYLLVRKLFASDPRTKANRAYQLALYEFHMAGVEREGETPLEYAREKVDPVFHAGFEEFMHVYLRLKYGSGKILDTDPKVIDHFASAFGPSVRKAKGFFTVFLNYFNLLLASRFFLRPDKNEYDNQSNSI